MSTIIYADGGCESNGSSNAHGYGSFSVNGAIHRFEFGSGETNNTCEYKALVEALTYCKDHQLHAPQVYMDSQLVVNQVAGGWKVRAPNLKTLNEQARTLWRELRAGLAWVPREEIVKRLGH